MKRHVFSTIFFISLFLNTSAQVKLDSIPPSGTERIQIGIELTKNNKYDEAIAEYNKVSYCDPSYANACYECALTYNYKKDYQKALKKCQESIDMNFQGPQAYIMKGSILDDMGRREEAINWLESLRKKYPFNQNLIYNLGICYLNHGNLSKSEELMQLGLHYNPYHISSHMSLARINYIMGRKAQSFLAYNMGILINPRVDLLRQYEEAISQQIDSIQKSYLYPYPGNINHAKWDELTGLLNAELAFKEDFPYNYKLNYLSCRQSYLLLQKMKFDEKDTTFYNQFYVRFFKRILKNNEFETFQYYTLKNINNEDINEWLTKNKELHDNFIEHAQEAIETWKQYGFSTTNEEKRRTIFHFDDNSTLESVGIMKDSAEPLKEGNWQFIDGDGKIIQKGNYRNNQRQGEFLIFWEDGSIKQKLNFKDDNFDGLNYTYHLNGKLSGIFPRKLGIQDGNEEEYTSSGQLITHYPYRDGSIHGNTVYVDYANGYTRTIPYRDNKCEGMMTEKWLNGTIKTEAQYADSLLNGSYKKWYASGQPEWEGSYKNNIQVGPWSSFNSNGLVSAKGTTEESGNPTGVYQEFDHDGNLTLEISGYKNGKPDGVQTFYFPNGKTQAKMTLEESRIKNEECFNWEGELIYKAEEKEGTLEYKYFFPEGQIKIEGKYVNGFRDGIWKTYNVLGKTLSEESWITGVRSGAQKYYYPNGNLELEYSCDSNLIVGRILRYFENGKISMEGYNNKVGSTGEWAVFYSNDSIQTRTYFIEGRLVGRRLNYSPTGKLIMEETFNDSEDIIRIKYFDEQGKLIDDINFPYDSINFTLHFPNGKTKAKITICDRQYHGTQEFFHPNEKLKSRQSYIFGKAEGEIQELDYNGKPVFKSSYVMNEEHGKYYRYNNGYLTFTSDYETGDNNGWYTEFHHNGRVLRKIKEKANERQGKSDCFAPDSTWMFSFHYVDDEISSVSYRDKQGKLHKNKHIDDNTTEIECYYTNGKLAARLPFSKTIFNGIYLICYSNGTPLREIKYTNDYRQGLSTYYYEDGKIKEQTNWTNGYRDGRSTLYFPNGQKELEGNFIAGKRHGIWNTYNETGKVTETLYYANDELYDIQ